MASVPHPPKERSGSGGVGRMKKKTANTVFFRYSPSESSITRKHFETYFSDVGPVKKCSIIRADNRNKDKEQEGSGNREAKGFGFCKFTCQDDAILAAKKLNNSQMALDYGLQVKVWVEVADTQNSSGNTDQKKKRIAATSTSSSTALSVSPKSALPEGTPSSDDKTMSAEEMFQLQAKKRTSRIIIRNLSFYATEYNIRQAMEEKFGEVVEINLPLVPVKKEEENENNKRRKKQHQQHRGFAFVTFANQKSAHKAVEACASSDGQLLIKKRPVAIDFSVSKFQHRQMKEQENREEQEVDDNDDDDDDESSKEDGNDTDDTNSDDDSESSDSSDDDSDTSDSDDEKEKNTEKPKAQDSHQSSLFLRNLPFDTTRHDVFTLFAKFGRISGIYLVRDKDTGLAKGTAFVKYEKEGGCLRALEASSTSSTSDNIDDFQSERNMMASLNGGSVGLFLHGRRILVDKAVDKNTAESLKVQRDEDGKPIDKKIGKDKRNLYLKDEGRVSEAGKDSTDPNSWENIPQSDQLKRGRAHKEKHTKLRSPLFFINPFRLSLRNLGKHIDESQLKALMAKGIEKGLEKNLVSREDIIAHWRAGGELTAREMIQKLNASDEDDDIIPSFNESDGIKKYVPSVFIDRDFQSKDGKASKVTAPSRGFGFAEFTHHAHALACLRELNNNTVYAAEFVAGGKKASLMKKRASSRKRKKSKPENDDNQEFLGEDGRVRIPRLLVEFTVENSAKARKQAERKAQQLANVQKQKAAMRQSSEGKSEKKKNKKSRGAQQREKKRKAKEEGTSEKSETDTVEVIAKKPKKIEEDSTKDVEKPTKKKGIKPQKKLKVDKDENAFQDMIQSYKKAFAGGNQVKEGKNERSEITKKRWFD